MQFARRTYLDWTASAPVTEAAAHAFRKALSACGNPSSPHAEGRAARELLEDARLRIARLAGTKPDAVVFTSGATEANALAIVGRIEALVAAGRVYADMHALYMPSAHVSVRGAMEALSEKGVRTEAMEFADGAVDLARLKEQLTEKTVLVVMDVVCGETGALYKVRDIRRVLDARAKGSGVRVTLHADASQAPLVESFELAHLGVDTVALDAQKVGGVRGIGCLIAPRRVLLAPLMRGGGQERELRPGTESSALAMAFAVTLEEAARGRAGFVRRASGMRAHSARRLAEAIPDALVNEGKENAPHILNLSLPERDTDYLVALLDEAGFAVSTKSACETDSAEGSNAVRALTGDEARARATLRVSWGPQTSARQLDAFTAALIRAVRFLDAHAI